MSKLEIDFELTGLKLKIKGDSDDVVSGKVADLQRQVQSLMNTIGSITQGASTSSPQSFSPNGEERKTIDATSQPLLSAAANKGAKRGRKPGVRPRPDAIDFSHNADTYGFPKQEWTTAQKAMWMIQILALEANQTEVTAGVITATFNKHFKSFGTIKSPNVTRDLGKEKGKTGWVNSNTSNEPQTWFLLESGKIGVSALIAESKGQSTT